MFHFAQKYFAEHGNVHDTLKCTVVNFRLGEVNLKQIVVVNNLSVIHFQLTSLNFVKRCSLNS